jgi:CheY-like chemotaxis protein
MMRKILFVDDDQILRAAIEQRFSAYRQSFATVSATDGFDAVQKLKEHPVSLAIVDLLMPRMDGMSLIDHLTQYYPDLPIIVISGIGDWEVSEVARNCSAFGYLNKPFQADDLVNMIQLVLAKEAEGGIMNDISPPVFMQLMEMDGRTCTIRILDNASSRGGILFFNQGALFDARVGEVSGIDAAHQIFSWDRTTIFINNRCRVTEDRIQSSLGSVIMKAVGMKDEQEERPEDYSEQESIAFLSDKDAGSAAPEKKPTGGSAAGGGEEISLEAVSRKLQEIGTLTEDRSRAALIEQLQRCGQAAGFGNFVAAVVDQGLESGKVIVASQPPGVMRQRSVSAEEIKKALLK